MNIRLDNVNVTVGGNWGGVAGSVEYGGKIESCHVTGRVNLSNSYDSVGGIAGTTSDIATINCMVGTKDSPLQMISLTTM